MSDAAYRVPPGRTTLAASELDGGSFWRQLLDLPPQAAGQAVSDQIGLAMKDPARYALLGCTEVLVTAPLRKRRRRQAYSWELVLVLGPGQVIDFTFPTADPVPFPCAPAYGSTLTRLGATRFGSAVGGVLPPSSAAAVGAELRADLDVAVLPGTPIALYEDGCGNVDFWFDGDPDRIHSYEHETGRVDHYCGGGFSAWFSKRLMEALAP